MAANEALWAALAEQVDRQIQGRPDYAEVVAKLSGQGVYDFVLLFDEDDAGGLDILTCAWQVRVQVADGWLTVATVSWRDLPLTLDDLRAEHAWATAQRGIGEAS